MEHVIPSFLEAGNESASNKSCTTCIWFVESVLDNEQTSCMALKKPLSNRNLSGPGVQQKAYEMQAEKCGHYSELKPDSLKPKRSDASFMPVHQAFFPMISVKPTEGYLKESVRSCSDCKYFNQSAGLDLGFASAYSACAAKGLIISGSNSILIDTALNCDVRSRGDAIYSNSEYEFMGILMPEYNPNHIRKFITDSEPAGNRSFPADFEPSVYVSPLPVDEVFKDQGVRTWYELKDPDNTGNIVRVPIFDRDIFPPDERAKIPSSSDEERPQDYVDHQGLIYQIMVAWMELDETPALIGPAGTGKTEVLRTLAWLMQVPFERISITSSTELDDILGKMLFVDNETKFRYGRLAAAWMKPGVICLDEPNVGPPEVWQAIRPLTDNSKQLVLDANKGERIFRNPNCFIGMAMNPAWDPKNAGAEFIADADSSRLLHIETHLPPWEVEASIIQNRCILDGWEIHPILLDLLRRISEDIRKFSDSGEIPISWGIRSQIKVARLLRWYKVEKAYLMAGLGSLEPASREILMDTIKSRVGNLPSQMKAYQEQEKAKKEREKAVTAFLKQNSQKQVPEKTPAKSADSSKKNRRLPPPPPRFLPPVSKGP